MKVTCGSDTRRSAIRNHLTINGIDYIYVLDTESADKKFQNPLVMIHCFKEVKALSSSNVHFKGGVRVKGIKASWAYPAKNFEAEHKDLVSEEELGEINKTKNPDRVLVVRASSQGDFSQYELRIVSSTDQIDIPAQNFDVILSKVRFSFKIECSKFDCACPEPVLPKLDESSIEYMAKDYSSFRKLILDRLSLLMPDWQERNPADIGMVMVELMAYVGDHLSYYQDAVGTEAYLGTCRRRISAMRHARLLDYLVHDGCNARAWVCFKCTSNSISLPKGTVLLTGDGNNGDATVLINNNKTITQGSIEEEIARGVEVFETMYDALIYKSKNKMSFYTWGESDCWLPIGCTKATIDLGGSKDLIDFSFVWEKIPGNDQENLKEYLKRMFKLDWVSAATVSKTADENELIKFTHGDDEASIRLSGNSATLSINKASVLEFQVLEELSNEHVVVSSSLRPGDILLFEENTLSADLTPNPLRCVAVQLTSATVNMDRLTGRELLEIEWNQDDALPFALCLTKGGKTASTIYGNTILTDHGYTVQEENLQPLVVAGRYYPKLREKPLIHCGPEFNPASQSAFSAFNYDSKYIKPAILLRDQNGLQWEPLRDLLSSGDFADKFVVEVEGDGIAYIRFSNANRKSWSEDIEQGFFAPFEATYRIGKGTMGNVGAESIKRIFFKEDQVPIGGIEEIRNPLPALGGKDAETIESIRHHAPQAFRKQERAVTETDYQEALKNYPQIQKAIARRLWTGSWYTMFVAIDREGGLPIDGEFKAGVTKFLNAYRLAGYDIEIHEPVFVPLLISIEVCLKAGYYEGEVRYALIRTFSNKTLEDGTNGFFHPDNFTFGQPLYLSRIYEAAMAVEGVLSVTISKFQRWGKVAGRELDDGVLTADSLEILRLDNDPNFAEYGLINIQICGVMQ
ncbi:MAG: baseplate J/gp47 family protein [Thermoproteota archaeon]|nr:baseplate J/gp47 family protein [Thermoproteota archaeon]